MEFTIAMIIALIVVIVISSLIFVTMKCSYNTGIKKINAEKQALINENTKLKETLQEQDQRLDFLKEAMDLDTNCTSQFKNKSGDEIVIMRKERYNDYEAQEERLNIIKEKCVNMALISESETVEQYNNALYPDLKPWEVLTPWNALTSSEFDKVKGKK